jgi:predicted Zn-dependent protease
MEEAMVRGTRWAVLLAWLVLACAGGDGIRLQAMPETREDYLRYVSFEAPGNENVLLRWRDDDFPLKVYLGEPPAQLFEDPAAVRAATREAVEVWTDAARPGIPRFEFVATAGEADIPINWAAQAASKEVLAHCYYHLNVFQRRFGVAQILMTGSDFTGRVETLKRVRLTLMHEMGHALGFGGHSPNPEDVMYGWGLREDGPKDIAAATELARQGEIPGTVATEPSERDRETLRLLYAKPPGARIGGARQAY